MLIHSNSWIFQDAVTTASNGSVYKSGPNDQLTVYITGTSTSRMVVFEGCDNNDNWYALPAVKLPELTTASFTTGVGEAWTINLALWVGVRCRVSAVSGGTVSIIGRIVDVGSSLISNKDVQVTGNIPAGQNYIGYAGDYEDIPITLTTALLGVGASYTQDAVDRLSASPIPTYVRGISYSNVSGTFVLEESEDGNSWSTTVSVIASAVTTTLLPLTMLSKRYFRFKYTNDGTAQGSFILLQAKQTNGRSDSQDCLIPIRTIATFSYSQFPTSTTVYLTQKGCLTPHAKRRTYIINNNLGQTLTNVKVGPILMGNNATSSGWYPSSSNSPAQIASVANGFSGNVYDYTMLADSIMLVATVGTVPTAGSLTVQCQEVM